MSEYAEGGNSNYVVKIHKKPQRGKRRFSTEKNSKNVTIIRLLPSRWPKYFYFGRSAQ